MIPSISTILAGFKAGELTTEQAMAMIQQHIELAVDLAVELAVDRDGFAKAALNGHIATGVRNASDLALAEKCYSMADAMIEARAA